MANHDLAWIATGRTDNLFDADIAARRGEISDVVQGARILVIGGAGSIGSSTVHELAAFAPRAMHIVDQNENELAELVRTLRSSAAPIKIDDLRTLPLDYGSVAFRAFVSSESPYDLVLNFAAIKHVRSEKDGFSTLQMFDTNIIKQARLLKTLKAVGFKGRYFSVSTDKAANPTSLMGASKRVMEHVMFDKDVVNDLDCIITSARFANVAFSNGSLLQSFENRLKKDQPLAAPKDTKRFFVSLKESGQLCLLAATTAPHGHILIPNLDPATALVDMQSIAEGFLKAHEYTPVYYASERDACQAVEAQSKDGKWPLLLTELSTSGEKPYEEFVGVQEQRVDLGYRELSGVPYLPLKKEGVMLDVLDRIDAVFKASENAAPNKEDLKAIIAVAEPAFLESHKETGQNLDQRV